MPFTKLEQLTRERDGWREECQATQRENLRLRTEINAIHAATIGQVWYWGGDGEDYPESLTCPVVMTADKLRQLLKMQ